MEVLEDSPAAGVVAPSPHPPFALSVDVEDYYQVQAFADRVSREDWTRYPPRVVENTRRLLDLFDGAGARATFFVLGWLARRHPALVTEIASRGHEVASHGFSHRMLTELTPSEFLSELDESRAALEEAAQRPVIGFRAPSYSLNEETLWALDVLADSGYEYDSSIYPIRRSRYGYPGGPTRPTRLDAGSNGIAEFPMTSLPLGPLRLPVLAGAYLRLLPSWVSLAALRYHRRRRLPLVVNVHPWEIDPAQPTIGPSRLAAWTHYAGLGKTSDLLRRILESSRFTGVGESLRDLGLIARRNGDRRE